MLHAIRRAVLTVALLATTVGAAATAEARDRYGHRGGGDDAAIAIGAGVVGLAIGAALASDNRRGYYRDRHYRGRYYYPRSRYRTSYYYQSYPGYYYDSYPRYRTYPRYRGDRYRSPYYNRHYRSRYHDGYSRYDNRRDYRYRNGW